MIHPVYTDKEAFEVMKTSIYDLLVYAMLAGLSILGRAIVVREAPGIGTMRTDGRAIEYDPLWVKKKGRLSSMFDFLHEWLHIFGNHCARCGSRDKKLWGYSCDVRVAHDALHILSGGGLFYKLDDDHVPAFPWAKDLSVEEIYEYLLKQQKQQQAEGGSSQAGGSPMDYTGYENYQPDMVINEVDPNSPEEIEFKQSFVDDLAHAEAAIESTGKNLKTLCGPAIYERLKEIKKCGVRWDILLVGRICADLGQEYATWVPPHKRWFPLIPLPSRVSRKEDELLLAIDISGSITERHVAMFRHCIIPAARRAKKTTIITFDQVIRETLTSTRPEELFKKLQFKTGSHSYTSVEDVFAEVDKRKPSAVAILTDGIVELPRRPYPLTNWVLIPGSRIPPWGRHVMIRESW